MGDPAGHERVVTDDVVPGMALAVIPRDLDATLVLVRHGETTWLAEGRFQGGANPPLSALGERQARLVAERLANPRAGSPLPIPEGDPAGCWHSPLDRAAAVAATIAGRPSPPMPLHVEPGLREIGQGDWEGRLHGDIAAHDAELLAAWRRDPVRHHAPGGEAVPDAAVRVGRALAGILAELRSATDGRPAPPNPVIGMPGTERRDPWAILVAHDGILRLSILRMFDLPLERFWSFPFAPCGITVVTIRGGGPSLRAHNLVDHLAGSGDGGPAKAAVDREQTGTL